MGQMKRRSNRLMAKHFSWKTLDSTGAQHQMKINTCKRAFSLSLSVALCLSVTAVWMAVWIWVDINSIVMNSSIDSGHRYHSSLWFQSFIVICNEGRAASTKHHYPSTPTTSGIGCTSHVFIFHSFFPYIIYSLLPTYLPIAFLISLTRIPDFFSFFNLITTYLSFCHFFSQWGLLVC